MRVNTIIRIYSSKTDKWLPRRLECDDCCVVTGWDVSPGNAALNPVWWPWGKWALHLISLHISPHWPCRGEPRDSSSDCLSARRLWEFLSLPLLHPLTLSLTWDSQTCCSVLTEVMKTQWVAVGGRTCLKSLEPPKHTTVHLEVMFNRERKWEQKKKKNTHKTVARE